MPKFGLIVLLSVIFASTAAFGATTKVIYPAYESATDTRFNDLIEILQTALEKTVPEFGPFELKPAKVGMNEARYLIELEYKGFVNIAWSSTSVDKERQFIPIRIPLRKGLLGYRIALIAKDGQAQVDQVQTIDDLKRLTIGQGIGWGDVKLYESNGLKVTKAGYENLFKMVAAGRFDLFPRGISEIFTEYDLHANKISNLAIEKNLLIYYPWPYYFFFNKKDAALVARIETGMRKMMEDGSFDAIFIKYNAQAIERANLKNRRIIRIKNDLLPKETPLNDAALWFDPVNYQAAEKPACKKLLVCLPYPASPKPP